jgi:SAM-dependent methyltransferase
MSSSDSISSNIALWSHVNAEHTDARAAHEWEQAEMVWGIFAIPEPDLGSPLGDVGGLDIVELGCGTAYFSAWFAQRGARPVGVDPTPAQLETARRMQEETGIHFPLVEAPAERVPLPDASFDLAFSEYGASLWADPELWVAEAARLLRPGGRLVFLTNSVLVYLCMPDAGVAQESLLRPQFGMYSIRWPNAQGPEGVEFHLAHGDWIRLLRDKGFEVESLIEVQAPADAEEHGYYEVVTPQWAQQWPAEEIWVARRRDG